MYVYDTAVVILRGIVDHPLSCGVFDVCHFKSPININQNYIKILLVLPETTTSHNANEIWAKYIVITRKYIKILVFYDSLWV